MSNDENGCRRMEESVFGRVKGQCGCVLILFTRRKPASTTQTRTTMAQQKGGGVFVVEKAVVKGFFRKAVVITLRNEDYECHDVVIAASTDCARLAEFVGGVAYEHASFGSASFVPDDCWGSVMPDGFIAG